MKSIKLFFCTFAALMMFAGCDELQGLFPGVKDLELSVKSLEFSAEESSQTIEITSLLAWEVKCDASWITISPDKGEASEEEVMVTVTVAKNEGEAREAEVVFSIEDVTKTITETVTVRQAALGQEPTPGPDPDPDPDPNPDPKPDMTGWGIVGALNGWGFASDGSVIPDIPMLADETETYLVAYNVEFPDGTFKIRQHGEWNEEYGNVGLYEFPGSLEVDHVYDVVNSWEYARDMYISSGTYDVWLDLVNLKLYMMTSGRAISEAAAGTPGEIPGEGGDNGDGFRNEGYDDSDIVEW